MTKFQFTNYGRKKSQVFVQATMEKVHAHGKNAFDFMAEVDEADRAREHFLLGSIWGETHKFAGFPTAVPIAVPDEFKITNSRVVHGCDGIPKWGPDRKIVVAKVRKRESDLPPFWCIDTHFHRAGKLATDERREHLTNLRKAVRTCARTGSVVVMMDYNLPEAPDLMDDQRVVIQDNTDCAILVERSVKFTAVKTGSLDMDIDGHDCEFFTSTLKAA